MWMPTCASISCNGHVQGGRGRPDFQGAINLTILHQIPPTHTLVLGVIISIHILGKVELNVAKDYALATPAGRVLLQHLELDGRLLQQTIPVHGQAQGDSFLIVVADSMLSDLASRGAAAVVGGRGSGQVPFYVGGARYEGDVVEVDDLLRLVSTAASALVGRYSRARAVRISA